MGTSRGWLDEQGRFALRRGDAADERMAKNRQTDMARCTALKPPDADTPPQRRPGIGAGARPAIVARPHPHSCRLILGLLHPYCPVGEQHIRILRFHLPLIVVNIVVSLNKVIQRLYLAQLL